MAGVGAIPPVDASVGLGHAYGAIVTQIMGEKPIPIVPVFFNTYFPPNQPTPSRCYDLGLALYQAIETSPADLRVGVVASGGLSHFVTDERLDHQLLAALRAGSEERLRTIPRKLLNTGSSEIRNWIAVAAASKHLKLAWDEYIPCTGYLVHLFIKTGDVCQENRKQASIYSMNMPAGSWTTR